MLCIGQKLVQRRAGPGRDHVEALRRHLFHAGIADDRIQAQAVADRFKKLALLCGCLEKRDLDFAAQQFRKHESGKARTAAQIGQCLRIRGHIADQLGAVPDMAVPDVRQRSGGNEIVAGIPVLEQTDISLQPRERFT